MHNSIFLPFFTLQSLFFLACSTLSPVWRNQLTFQSEEPIPWPFCVAKVFWCRGQIATFISWICESGTNHTPLNRGHRGGRGGDCPRGRKIRKNYKWKLVRTGLIRVSLAFAMAGGNTLIYQYIDIKLISNWLDIVWGLAYCNLCCLLVLHWSEVFYQKKLCDLLHLAQTQ